MALQRATHIQDRWRCSESCALRSQRQPVLSSELRHLSKQNRTLCPPTYQPGLCEMYHSAYQGLRVVAIPTMPLIDAMLMIQPRSPLGCGCCFNICLIAYFEPRKTERALIPMTRSHSSSFVSCINEGGGAMPALFTILYRHCQILKQGNLENLL